MKCIECGFENVEENKFCANCGLKLEPMSCNSCGKELTKGVKFCGKCGEVNPYFKDPDPSKKINREPIQFANFFRRIKHYQKYIIFGWIIFISLLTFGISFGGIASANSFDWQYDDGEADFIDFDIVQTSTQLYSGYFSSLSLNDEDERSEYYVNFGDDLSERLNEYDDVLSTRDYERIFSSFNFFQLTMLSDTNQDSRFFSTVGYFITILILFILQLLPLLILGLAIYIYVKEKSLIKLKYLFLASAILGLLLTFFLPNLINFQTDAGGGLKTYITFMFIGFGFLALTDTYERKQIFRPTTIFYVVDVITVTLLFVIATGAFIRVGYKDTPTKTVWATFQMEESIDLVNVFNEDFEYLSNNSFYDSSSPYLDDEDLSSFEQKQLAELSEYSYLFFYELFDSNTGQNIFIAFTILVSVFTAITAAVLLFVSVSAFSISKQRLEILLKGLLVLMFVTLIVLSIIGTVQINDAFDSLDEPYMARISIWLILGVLLSTASIVFTLMLPHKQLELPE